jgi:hypothetical protein
VVGLAASLGLVTAMATGLSSSTAPAAAQDLPQSPAETGTIRNGFAKATALVGRIGPGVGNLELAMRGGVAVTQVTNSLAQATSQTADLGLIGSSLTGEGCSGRPATFTPEDLPQPTFVDNRKGDAELARDESGTDGSPLGAGRMQVAATKAPVGATASTTSAAFELAPGVSIGGGRGQSTTKVLPGEGRQAEATVTSSLNLGGIVTMDGMQWRAFHRTGVKPLAAASFDIGRATVGALPFPTDDMGAFESAANTALAPFGVTMSFPRIERFQKPSDLVRVTPMRITLQDSQVGKTLLGPALDASREQRGELFEQLAAAMCDAAGAFLVADVVVSVIAGTGFVTVEFGGAEALSSDFGLVNPFGAAVAPPSTFDAVPPALAGTAATDLPAAAPGISITPPVAAITTLPAAPVVGGQQAVPASAITLSEVCESIHPNGDRCRDGAAVAFGLLALLAASAIAVAEVVWNRRRSGEVSP